MTIFPSYLSKGAEVPRRGTAVVRSHLQVDRREHNEVLVQDDHIHVGTVQG